MDGLVGGCGLVGERVDGWRHGGRLIVCSR